MHISMTTIPIKLNVKPSSVSSAAIREEIQNEARSAVIDELFEITDILESLVSTWRHSVYFKKSWEDKGDEFSGTVSTDDKIFYFLDKGTGIRFATMTPDFEPKTTPGSLVSGPGKGGLWFINPNHPQPGIVAREFMKTIAEQRGTRWVKIVSKKAMKKYRNMMYKKWGL